MEGHQIITFGKYKGKTFNSVITSDIAYTSWCISQIYNGSLYEFARYVTNKLQNKAGPLDGIQKIDFGKYKGNTFDYVIADDINYTIWCLSEIFDKPMFKFAEYAKNLLQHQNQG